MEIKKHKNKVASFLENIKKGVKKGIISFDRDQTRITYSIKKPYSTSFKNPEEKVRAAYFCELVLNYLYPTDRIQFEVPIKPDKDRIDLLVYKDDECKEPYLLVECKRDGISDTEFQNAVKQAFRYANYQKAWYAVAVAGNTIERFNVKDFVSGERKDNVISDIPTRYGKPPKYKYYKQEGKNLKIVSREQLIKALERCHDTVWQGGKLAPTTAFDEMAKLLFCKLKDEKSTTKNKAYQFQIGTNETPNEVFTRINAIYQGAKQEDEEVFREDIHLPPEVVFSTLKHLQELAINNIDLDTKGIAFEKFMQDFFKGKMGQFFTPRNVVQFSVEMMQPNSEMYVLDPASGSGGYLLNAMNFVKAYAEDNYTDELEIYNHWHDFAKHRLFGIEINEQIARVCKMNMIIHDDGHTNVISTDSLEDMDHIQSIKKNFKKNSFDLILTNPPFGATVKGAEKEYLQKYVLGNNRKNQKTEILFIERCVDFLKPGTGKMAMVLPDGILNNSSLQYVRDFIMDTCQVLAMVSLPKIAFSHYGADVKSSLLFARKKEKNEEPKNYPIFMAIAEHIGYDATGRETLHKNDLPKIQKQYIKFEQTQDVTVSSDWQNKIFLINQNEFAARMDPPYYKLNFIKNSYRVRAIPNKRLGELINFSSETWNRAKRDYFINKFSYIQISGIDLQTGDIKNILEMNISKAPKRAKMIVREDDIIISTTAPNRGAISLIDKRFDGFIASTGFAIIRKVKNEINRKYLFYVLRFSSTLKQFEQRSTGGLYPIITKAELRKVLIPFPSKKVQIRIVDLMDRAYALKKQKEAEAKRLQDSIDSYVLEELGIKLSEVKQQNIFTVNLEDIKGQRFDVEYYQLNFEFLNQLKNLKTINQFIIEYKKGTEVGSSKYIEYGIPFVRVSDINEGLQTLNFKTADKKICASLFEQLKENFCPKKGELLYTKDGTIGLSYLVTKEENYIVSGAILRLICENIELAKYLRVILSLQVYKDIANKESVGTIIKHLNLKGFLNIPIPFPEKYKREKIVSKVDEIKFKVKSLSKEAAQAVEKAKQEVENILFKT